MKTFDWIMVWTLVLYVIDAIGAKELATWQIFIPVMVGAVLGLFAVIALKSGDTHGSK